MHIHEMPKGHRQPRNQGVYRQSPMVPTTSSQYMPHNMVRNNSHMGYYQNPTDMLQQSQGQQQSTYNVYNAGGPVQQPMNYTQLPAPLPTLPFPTSDPPTSLRASSGAWTPHDDSKLMQARAQGLNWAPIQQQHFPNKTANACRKRHERLMEKRNSDEWDSARLERLGAAYNTMKKEMWQQLGEACGEKWQVVEQKCMSMGIKNLQHQARAAQRRGQADASATSPAIPIAQLNSYGNGSGSLGHPSSHSHSTSLSSVHSNSHIPVSNPMNNHYTTGPSSFNSASGMTLYDDSGLGGEVNEVDQDYEHDNNDGSNSDGSRSANSAYGHHPRTSLSVNGYNGHAHNGSASGIPRSWNEQHMMVGTIGNTRLPSLQDGMGLDRILDQRGGR